MGAPERFDVQLVGSRRLSPSVRELVLERTDERPVVFEPGQWVNLIVPSDLGELKRAYSIASAPTSSPRFELAVTRVFGGPGSERLHDLDEGATLAALGPGGLFTRSASDERPALLVGTGTGVTPLRSMLKAALAADSKAPLWLLFGVRREEDVLYRDELQKVASEHPNVRVEITLSKPEPDWKGRRGYVQEHLPELWSELGRDDAQLYVCGLEKMVKTVRTMARGELGIDRRSVHQERYD